MKSEAAATTTTTTERRTTSSEPKLTDLKTQVVEAKASWPPAAIVDKVADSLNRVIVIGVNCGFIDMADNYLNSIVKLGVTNYVIVPMDSIAHEVMSKAYPGHVVPIVPELEGIELSEQSSYNSEGFRILTSIRPTFLLHFLEAGYAVFYNDVDMVWRRNAFTSIMELNQDKAFLVPGKGGKYGDGACTSTIFMRPTEANINFVKSWQKEMATGKHGNDQFGFNAVLNTQSEGKTLPKLWGDSEEFPTARDYFSPQWNKDTAIVVHNNGLKLKDEKILRFKRFNMWELSGKVGDYTCDAPSKKTS
jgi:hypothetical protein